jgi:hypothetical protein
MNQVVTSAIAEGLEAAKAVLGSPDDWPSSASGFAYRIFGQTGTPKSDFMARPLKQTTAALLRRTPELAGFGYVIDLCDEGVRTQWTEGISHLRGREIYPADRQSFIFNPIEILGIAGGLAALGGAANGHREWLSKIILQGLNEGQFRTPLSRMAAKAALNETSAPTEYELALDFASLVTPELILAAGINLGFGRESLLDSEQVERIVVDRLMTERVTISDAAEAATVLVLLRRIASRIDIGNRGSAPVDLVISLCRRFPLFVDQLQRRQRGRGSFPVNDEYDVQDLLHALLKLHFEDVRPEEYTPSYGGNSSKVDFYLPHERIVVEAKKTRANLGQREVTDELLIDAARYTKMNDVDTLICLVYDPDRRCSNPASIENDIANSGSRLRVGAVVCPRGL